MDQRSMVNPRLSRKKRAAIVDAALQVFLERGYGGTSIDEIVKRAGGSKATVYKHFHNKEDLFTTVIDQIVSNRAVHGLDPEMPPREALMEFALSRLKIAISKEHSALRRIVIGECARFPKIARRYYLHGPEKSLRQLAKYFTSDIVKENISIDDPETAAQTFSSMLVHPIYQRLLYSATYRFTLENLNSHAELVVAQFLKFYSR